MRDLAVAAADGAESAAAGTLRKLRAEIRRIERRDFFPPAERTAARAAVDALAERVADGDREPA